MRDLDSICCKGDCMGSFRRRDRRDVFALFVSLSQTVNQTSGFVVNCDVHTCILRVLRRCVPCELRRYHLAVLRRHVLGHKFNEYHWFYI